MVQLFSKIVNVNVNVNKNSELFVRLFIKLVT